MTDHPLRPVRHRRHGRPLPHHQANVTQADLIAIAEATFPIACLCGISTGFPVLSPTTRHVTYALLTRAPLYLPRRAFSFDLHVLGMPPAFVLSQDQTLQAYILKIVNDSLKYLILFILNELFKRITTRKIIHISFISRLFIWSSNSIERVLSHLDCLPKETNLLIIFSCQRSKTKPLGKFLVPCVC